MGITHFENNESFIFYKTILNAGTMIIRLKNIVYFFPK